MRIIVAAIFLSFATTALAADSIWDKNYSGPIWHTDFDQAVKLAQTQKRPVLAYFSGSDWCPPCQRLDKKALTQSGFQAYVSENFVLVNFDFPEATTQSEYIRHQNATAQQQFGVRGFPYLLVIDPQENTVLDRFSGCSMAGFYCSEKRLLKKLKAAVAKSD